MPTYIVQLHVGFDRRPTRDEQAFLGSMHARVSPWGGTDLGVVLEVEATDFTAALTQATQLVVNRLGGQLQTARLALKGTRVQPNLWRRWRRRTSWPDGQA
jgi:hypothetical protein